MRCKLGLAFFCGSVLLFAATGQARGDWESSGGDGVACWADSESAQQADRELRNQGHLSLQTKKKIVTLEVLEIWEHKKATGLNKIIDVPQTPEQVLEHVAGILKRSVPVFSRRYTLAAEKIHFQTWKNEPHLSDIRDSHPIRDIRSENPNCRLIQLAVRKSKIRHQATPTEVYVSVDKWLYENKLNAFNQAALQMHEQLYIVAKSLGQKSSNRTRQVVIGILLQAHRITDDPMNVARQLSRIIHHHFGEYIHIFGEDELAAPQKTKGQQPNQYTRFLSLARVFDMASTRLRECLRNPIKLLPKDLFSSTDSNDVYQSCSIYAMEGKNGILTDGPLTDEEAFMVVSWFLLYLAHGDFLSEHLIDWPLDDFSAVSRKNVKDLETVCKLIANSEHAHGNWNPMLFVQRIKQAQKYCHSVINISAD